MASIWHSFLLLNDGTVFAFGENSYGQLGLGDTYNRTSPVRVPISNVKDIVTVTYDNNTAPYPAFTYFLLNDGTVKACGYNGYGQLGIGNTTNQSSLVTVPVSNVKQIVAGGHHVFFLLNDGTVKACGRNDYGQLGIENTTNQTSIVDVPIFDVKQIACGAHHTVFLLNDGTVKACGYNGYGQLGIGNTTNQTSPVTVPVSNVRQVVCGAYNTFFLLNDGTIMACGRTNAGQIGIGLTGNQLYPVFVNVFNVKEVVPEYWRGDAGVNKANSCTFFLLNDGTVKACGYNGYGQLGIGNTTNQTSPVTVPVSNVRQIVNGDFNVFFMLNDGTVKACGYNGYGQLGIGNTTNQTSPVTVPVSNVKEVFSSLYHTVFLLNDGTVKACGHNGYGQLGIGNTTNRSSPVTVLVNNVGQVYFDKYKPLPLSFVYPYRIKGNDSAISRIDFKVNGVNVASINNFVSNQEYSIKDYVSGVGYGDVLKVEGYDSNNNLVDSIYLNVKEDFSGKQGVVVTTSSIDTSKWDVINNIFINQNTLILDFENPDDLQYFTTNCVLTSVNPFSGKYCLVSILTTNTVPVFSRYVTVGEAGGYISFVCRVTNTTYGFSRILVDRIEKYRVRSNADWRNCTVFIPPGKHLITLEAGNSYQNSSNRSFFDNIVITNVVGIYPYPVLLSNDRGQTWYTYRDNQFIPVENPAVDIFTQGITDLASLPKLTRQNFLTDTLDIMVGLKSVNISETPIFKGILIHYNANDYIVTSKTLQELNVNLVPKLSSNTSSPLSASSVANISYHPVWKAFNGTVQDVYDCWVSASVTGWLQVDFGVPRVVNKYVITARNDRSASTLSPKTWTFEGSNDGTNWVVLDTRTDETDWFAAQRREYVFYNSKAYRYYRINITANNGATQTAIGELELMLVINHQEFVYAPSISEDVYKFTFNIIGENYKVFLSNDGGNTWLTYDGKEFIRNGDGNYVYEINNLSSELLQQFLPINNFRMKFVALNDRALITQITFNYDIRTNAKANAEGSGVLLPIPPEYFKNVLVNDTYVLKLEEGIGFDDVNTDYNFYSTPTKIKLKPLNLGKVIGNKWSEVFAFEVINAFENQAFDVTLQVAYNDEYATVYNDSALLNDAILDSEKTVVQMSLSNDPFIPMYPLKFRLNKNSKQVVYLRMKPTLTTRGTQRYQIKLSAIPV